MPTVRDAAAVGRHEDPLLPALPALAPLLPGGALRRGTAVQVAGSLALVAALLAGPSSAGSWCAVVNIPEFGAAAAAELGVSLERLALVPAPGRQWPAVVAALLDGVDVVAVRPPGRVRGGEARRLAARVRERGAVLLPVGPWEGADLRLSATASEWMGLAATADGGGVLRARRMRVRAEGRGAAARPRQTELWLPARDGGVAPAEPVARAELGAGPAIEAAAELRAEPVVEAAPRPDALVPAAWGEAG